MNLLNEKFEKRTKKKLSVWRSRQKLTNRLLKWTIVIHRFSSCQLNDDAPPLIVWQYTFLIYTWHTWTRTNTHAKMSKSFYQRKKWFYCLYINFDAAALLTATKREKKSHKLITQYTHFDTRPFEICWFIAARECVCAVAWASMSCNITTHQLWISTTRCPNSTKQLQQQRQQ